MTLSGLSINLATVREQYGFGEAVDACLRHGILAPPRAEAPQVERTH